METVPPTAQIRLIEEELLAVAVIAPDAGQLKPQYAAAHARARDKFAAAYIGLRKTHVQSAR